MKLIQALRSLSVETGSLACLGCGYEHNCSIHGCAIIRTAIDRLKQLTAEPTIDAAPVVHGRWIMRGGRFRCSVCDGKALWRDVGGTGGWSHEYEQATTDVCPSCGARMDGGEKHEAD